MSTYDFHDSEAEAFLNEKDEEDEDDLFEWDWDEFKTSSKPMEYLKIRGKTDLDGIDWGKTPGHAWDTVSSLISQHDQCPRYVREYNMRQGEYEDNHIRSEIKNRCTYCQAQNKRCCDGDDFVRRLEDISEEDPGICQSKIRNYQTTCRPTRAELDSFQAVCKRIEQRKRSSQARAQEEKSKKQRKRWGLFS